MKRLKIAGLVLLFCGAAFLPDSPAAGSAPLQVDILVDSTLSISGKDYVSADDGKSFALLYWSEPGNNALQSQQSVYLLKVAGTEVVRTNLGKGVRVTAENVYDYERQYLGYYRFPADHGVPAAQLKHYVNTTYRVGSEEQFTEVRIYPPFVSIHAGYQSNAAGCKNCHTVYDGTSPRRTTLEICLECHDGTKSSYDVLRGRVRTEDGWVPSPAGPFGSPDNPSASFHNVFLEVKGDGGEQPALYAPGGGGLRMNLTCLSCHSVHAEHTGSPHRLLRYADNTPVQAYSYMEKGQYRVLYIDGMNQFCSQCHGSYNEGVFAGTSAGGNGGEGRAAAAYRHPTGIEVSQFYGIEKNTLPLEYRDNKAYLTCKTCHLAHGAALLNSAQLSPELSDLTNDLTEAERRKYNYEGKALFGEGEQAGTSSMLKRREGMGICLECHLDQIWGNTSGARW